MTAGFYASNGTATCANIGLGLVVRNVGANPAGRNICARQPTSSPRFRRLSRSTEMAITWIFENEGDRCYVQRRDGVDQISILTWSNLEQGSMTVHSELEAVQLIRAIEQELESRGWTLKECCPERRQGGDRRKVTRTQPDRRSHGS